MSGVITGALSTVGAISSATSGISRTATTLSAALSGNYALALSGLGVWAQGMQVASWRGLPFAVRESVIRKGRRVAIHDYPYRDEIWVEDLGRGRRQYSFGAFLVGDDVLSQSAAFQTAAEQEGAGTLVHPTLGQLNCSIVGCAVRQTVRGRTIELELTFLETAGSLTPALVSSTQNGILSQVTSTLSAIATDFETDVMQPLEEGASVVQAAIGTAETWANVGLSLIGDAKAIFNSVSGLVGNYGRYSSAGMTLQQPVTASVSSLLASNTTNRTAAKMAVTAALASMAPTSAAAFAAAISVIPTAVAACAVSPKDQIRLLMNLANYSPAVPASTAPIGAAIATTQTATAALCRRAAMCALATACANFQPYSSQQAMKVMTNVTTLLDAEIIIAADAGDLNSYQALRALRAAVSKDLITRAAQLPSQITVTTSLPEPSLVIAYRLYQDASRSDDLIARVDPINPAFMPTEFQALSS